MHKMLIIAGAVAMIAAPAVSHAAIRCRDNQGREVAGTVVGAIAGGLVGNAVSHGRDRGLATALGAAGGAYVGNRLAAGSTSCPTGYYAYDDGVAAHAYQRPAPPYTSYNSSGYIAPAPTYDTRYSRTLGYQSEPDYYETPPSSYDSDRPTYSSSGVDRLGTPYWVGGRYPTASGQPITGGYTNPDGYYSDRYYNQSPTDSSNSRYSTYDSYTGYESKPSYSSSASVWTDGYGRTCRWRDSADYRGNHSWVQDCR